MPVLPITFIVIIAVITGAASSESPSVRELDSSPDHSTLLQSVVVPVQQSKVFPVFPIDFVYCWSGEALQQDDERKETGDSNAFDDHNLGLGFGELRYSILFLEAHAPWFNKVYILVDTPTERPTWLTEASKDKIVMIDRCSLFNRSQDCPTQNDAACRAVMHKIPGLSEHFVALDDDMLVNNPASPSDFFASQGTPLILVDSADVEVPMYSYMPQGPDMPPKSVPTRMSSFQHVPCPNLVSFAWTLEDIYPDWFAFVRSHRTRFTCCNASLKRTDEFDEEFHRIYPHMLLKLKVGTQLPAPARHEDCGVDSGSGVECVTKQLQDPALMFLNINNIKEVNSWHKVQEAMEKRIRGMPASKFVVSPQRA